VNPPTKKTPPQQINTPTKRGNAWNTYHHARAAYSSPIKIIQERADALRKKRAQVDSLNLDEEEEEARSPIKKRLRNRPYIEWGQYKS
jgi:hypothetical protein